MAVEKCATLKKIWADGGYAGQCVVRAREQHGVDLEIVKRSDNGTGSIWLQQGEKPPVAEGFKVIRWRWLVERTFGWLGRNRRLSKDYEENIASSLAWVRLGFVWLLARRLGAA